MKRKLTAGLSAFLCLIMLFAALPMTVFADNGITLYFVDEDESNSCMVSGSVWESGDTTAIVYSDISVAFSVEAAYIKTELCFPDEADLNSAELTVLYNNNPVPNSADCATFFGDNNSILIFVIIKLPCTHPSATPHASKDATCTETGNEAYWECTKCGKLFSDADCKIETKLEDVTLSKLGHKTKDGSITAEIPADGCKDGCKSYHECERCGKYIDSGNELIGNADDLATWKAPGGAGNIPGDPTKHRSASVVTKEGKPANCKEDGYKSCIYCKDCGKYAETVTDTPTYVTLTNLIDNYDTWKTTAGKGLISKLTAGQHLKTDVEEVKPGKAATCTEDGSEAHYHCTLCDTYSLTATLTDDIYTFGDSVDKSALTLTKLGHDYPDTWEAYNAKQHKRVCSRDDSHIEYANHTFGKKTLKKRADDGAVGEYTCQCSVCKYTKSEKFSYKITNGEGSTYTIGSKKDLTIIANGEFSKFEKLQIDGKDLASSNYTAVSGSTKVTLKSAYLEKLKTGKHTIKYIYSDGSCSGSFKVAKKSEGTKDDQPRTGYNNHIVLWISLVGISAAAFAWSLIWLRKRGLLCAAAAADEKAVNDCDLTKDE